MTSTWGTSFAFSVTDGEQMSGVDTSLFLSPTESSLFRNSSASLATQEVLGQLNHLRVPGPAPPLTIPAFQPRPFTLTPFHQKRSAESLEGSSAESVWTPFGLPQGTCGISFNAHPESEGMTQSVRDLLSMTVNEQTGESFFVDVVSHGSQHGQPMPSSILLSAHATKVEGDAGNHNDNSNQDSLKQSCDGSGLRAIRQLRIIATPQSLQPHPPISPLLNPRPVSGEVSLSRPSHILTAARHEPPGLAAEQGPVGAAPHESAQVAMKRPWSRPRRTTHPCVPSFAAHTPMYSPVMSRCGGRRLPRGPAFFPAWSAHKAVPPPLPEELLYEDLFDMDCEGSLDMQFSFLVQQPTR